MYAYSDHRVAHLGLKELNNDITSTVKYLQTNLTIQKNYWDNDTPITILECLQYWHYEQFHSWYGMEIESLVYQYTTIFQMLK